MELFKPGCSSLKLSCPCLGQDMRKGRCFELTRTLEQWFGCKGMVITYITSRRLKCNRACSFRLRSSVYCFIYNRAIAFLWFRTMCPCVYDPTNYRSNR